MKHNPRWAGAKSHRKERKTMSDRQKEARAAVRRQLMRWKNTIATIERVKRERTEREEELAVCYDLRPAQLTGMPGAGGPGDPTGRAALANDRKARRLEKELDEMQTRLLNLQHYIAQIEDEVNGLPVLECLVIRARYLDHGAETSGYWQKIASKVHVSESHAKRLEAQAVDKLAGLVDVGRSEKDDTI